MWWFNAPVASVPERVTGLNRDFDSICHTGPICSDVVLIPMRGRSFHGDLITILEGQNCRC